VVSLLVGLLLALAPSHTCTTLVVAAAADDAQAVSGRSEKSPLLGESSPSHEGSGLGHGHRWCI
jgi:hypothetical protein